MKFSTPRINKALNLAGELHEGQDRKGDGLPYIIHPFAVALILMDYSEDEDVIVAGLLHDTVEDTPYSKAQVTEDFGARVAEIVMSVTETNKNDPWQKRKDDYLAHLREASFEAKLLCAADKIHNLLSMIAAYEKLGMEAEKAFNAPLNKKIWFYNACYEIIKEDEKMPKELIEKLQTALTDIKSIC